MLRRNILTAALGTAGAIFGVAAGTARANAATPDKSKVVYHLTDLDKVAFVLGNIRHHYDGMGGADKVTIALVVHGPALKAFHAGSANPDVVKRAGEFSKAGLALHACGNTMKLQHVTLNPHTETRGSAMRSLAPLGVLGLFVIRRVLSPMPRPSPAP